MYKLYYERDTILSSGRVLRGDVYIMDEQKNIIHVIDRFTNKAFYCTPYKKVAARWLNKLNKGAAIATRF